MTRERDGEDEMIASLLDIELDERLLDHGAAPVGAPDGYQRLAVLVRETRWQAAATHREPDERVVVAIALAVRAAEPVPTRRRVVSLGTVAAAIAALIALSGTAAAAATNHLPEPAQAAVSRIASAVGIDVPTPDDDAPPSSDRGHDDPASAPGPPASQPGTSATGSQDSRPECAGNPSSDQPGCAVHGDPSLNGNGAGTGGAAQTTDSHSNNSGGVASDHTRAPDATTPSGKPKGKP